MAIPPANPQPRLQLTADEQRAVGLASRQGVAQIFQQLSAHLQNRTWVGTNTYAADALGTLRLEGKAGQQANLAHLGEYMAASGPMHCVDGWTYAGRAISCLLTGDTRTARHLAYYAELRAALSLLATAGIGVFNRRHFIIDAQGQCVEMPRGGDGTHIFVWHALHHWSSLRQAADIVARAVTPSGFTLEDWFNALFARGGGLGVVTQAWLFEFGLDLGMHVEDRDARDLVSYGPSRLAPTPLSDPLAAAGFVHRLWRLNAPLRSSRFDSLDRYLLRRSLELASRSTILRFQAAFEVAVRGMLQTMNISADPAIEQAWFDFLTHRTEPMEPELIQEASSRDAVTHPRHPLQVLSRALLLLRLATGSCASLISDALYSARDLEFWWSDFGYELGLWDTATRPGDKPGDVLVLWDEVQGAVDTLASWCSSKQTTCHAELTAEQPAELWTLAGAERMALWGLLP